MMKLAGTDGTRLYSWELKPGVYILGRSEQADLFVNDNTVSRKHAQIRVEEVGRELLYYLKDNNSRNGTFHNGEDVREEIAIKDGDRIMIGQVEFKLSSKGEVGEKSQPITYTARMADTDLEKSVYLPHNEALKPLPSKVRDLPDVLPTLFEMAKILILPEPKEKMLQTALQLVAKVIPAERLAILTHLSDNEIITSACVLPDGKDPGSFNLSQTIVREILSEKASILIDPLSDPRYQSQDSIIMSEIKSAMAVPLFDDQKVLGILYVDTTNPIHKYNNDYLHLLATFGNQIASRLLNYELMHERQEKQVLEAELRRASMIQESLLPKSSPETPGFKIHSFQEQCRMVGGDLYDVCKLDDGRILFLLADVSGKGLGAALLMSNILASFRILYSEPKVDLIRIISQVSMQMFKYSRPEDFATLFMGVIDLETNKISYVNAGHNPPLIMRADGREDYLEPSGTMIGAFDINTWTVDNVELNSGDSLVIFTDGVVEAECQGKYYGESRLLDFIKKIRTSEPVEMVASIVGDVLEYIGDSPRSDDITMIVIKKD